MKTLRSMVAVAAAGLIALSACTSNSAKTADGPIKVTIKDDSCQVSATSVPSGTVSFELKNEGTVRNEFEILAPDKLRIVGERENLGPGTTTKYSLTLEPGKYFTACKKNMVGALVGTTEFTVTDSGKKVAEDTNVTDLKDKAVTAYISYLKDQTGQLVAATDAFVKAYLGGNLDEARKLYPTARQHYERIEPTAESFGDLDPKLDEREADWQEADDKDQRPWTGWHAIEKDLWRPAGYAGFNDEQRKAMADNLVNDTKKLYDKVYSPDFKVSLADISNGAIGLLEEVATSKITGEEEAFSHTDLYDFKANVEGAEVAFGDVEPLAKLKDPELAKEIKTRFADLNETLAKYKEGDGYVSYEKLDDQARKELSNQVNALRKPLGKLTEAILK